MRAQQKRSRVCSMTRAECSRFQNVCEVLGIDSEGLRARVRERLKLRGGPPFFPTALEYSNSVRRLVRYDEGS
jgi:hypothetical protein